MLRYINDTTTAALEKALEGQTLRQKAVANNIANVDTPNYRPQRVDFEQQLQAALAAGSDDEPAVTEAVDRVRPEGFADAGPAMRRDGSGVDIEREMVDLADTALQQHALVRLLSKKLQMLRSVATEGAK